MRRAWRIYADPAASEAAGWLKVLIPLEFAAFVYRLFAPDDWPPVSGVTFVQVCLWYGLLWFIRQRDEARAENEDLKAKVSTYEIAFQGMPLVVQAMRRRTR